ncbi:MAG: hypothetical protein GC204_21105 [Chloroflexi bacterium]|nr:hypothetical protein [Chloroflexota bacterium]
MAPYPFSNEGDQWVLRLDDFVVVQLCFDYRVTLLIGSGSPDGSPDYFSVVATRFSFMDKGKIHSIDAEGDLVGAGALLALRMRPVHEIAIAPLEGVLHIRFAGDGAIVAEADADHEAWELNGIGTGSLQGLKIVCVPGGELAVWDAQG